MSSVYSPNTANDPASFTLPSDGDVKPVASVRAGLEGVIDLAGRLRALLRGVLDGAGILSFIHARLTSPTLSGTITVETPIHGDGTTLYVSQAAETTIVLGKLIAPGEKIAQKILQPDASGGQTYAIADGNLWYLPDEVANRTWHLASTGAALGNTIFVSAQRLIDASHSGVNLTVDFNAGANSIGLGSTGKTYAYLFFDGSFWGVIAQW